MADGQFVVDNVVLDGVREFQESQHIGNGCSHFADSAGRFLLSKPEVVDEPAVRFRFINGVEVLTLTSLTSTGTSARPASMEARQRLSPAIKKKPSLPSSSLWTINGWITPFSRIESASSSSAVWSKSLRGW
jgi:hypothetical protein